MYPRKLFLTSANLIYLYRLDKPCGYEDQSLPFGALSHCASKSHYLDKISPISDPSLCSSPSALKKKKKSELHNPVQLFATCTGSSIHGILQARILECSAWIISYDERFSLYIYMLYMVLTHSWIVFPFSSTHIA